MNLCSLRNIIISLIIVLIPTILITYVLYKNICIKVYHMKVSKVKRDFVIKEVFLMITIIITFALIIEVIGLKEILDEIFSLPRDILAQVYGCYIACQLIVCLIPLGDK